MIQSNRAQQAYLDRPSVAVGGPSPRALALTAGAVIVLALLTLSLGRNPFPSQDLAVLSFITGLDAPGLKGTLQVVSFVTDGYAFGVVGVVTIGGLLLVGRTRQGLILLTLAIALVLATVAADQVLGAYVGRGRPLADVLAYGFPSGHVLASTVVLGTVAYLAYRRGWRSRKLVALSAAAVLALGIIGFSRLYLLEHWPSDVAGGLLLGAIFLVGVIHLYDRTRNAQWIGRLAGDDSTAAVERPGVTVARSIASEVILDANAGTATKLYRPPLLVSMIYWLAFQAPFPYVRNRHALDAAVHRRSIAGLLTQHRFGKNLVAPALAVQMRQGKLAFITRLIPGQPSPHDESSTGFLGEVSELFGQAGLSVWQVNPNNPHAHTNLIRTQSGDQIIIDLESALATPFPAGQVRSVLKAGNIPIFDDIDFARLRAYVEANRKQLGASLGTEGFQKLCQAIASAEESMVAWKSREPRLWGRAAGLAYRLLNWRAAADNLVGALNTAENKGQEHLATGIGQWEEEGRLSPAEARALRLRLAAPELQAALRHLGAHVALTALLRFPLGSVARFAWSLRFMVADFRGRTPHSLAGNIHTPLVIAVSLVPGFGGFAYLLSRPMRQRLLMRLAVDQSLRKLPFRAYLRLPLLRLAAPRLRLAKPLPREAALSARDPASAGSGDCAELPCA